MTEPEYRPLELLNENHCLLVLMLWARRDEQRKIALENDLDKIERGVKELGGKTFGRLQAAMVLYRLIEKGYYPRSLDTDAAP